MQNIRLKQWNTPAWFGLFIATHFVAWSIVPILVRLNLPLDAIEGTIWGHQLQWGYDKNPYLNGWLTALATYLDGQQGWMIYLFSQFSVVACFWSIWQIAKRMLSPALALISVLILESIQYYNFHAIDFNDNTLELGLWGLASYYFYRCMRQPTPISWILTGVCLGLGMMAKYYTLTLLASMGILFLLLPAYRHQVKTLPPYLGLAGFLIVTLPHIVWLFSHEFITVTYVFARASNAPSWINHFFFPAQFAWQQFEAFLPAVILVGLFCTGKMTRPVTRTPLRREDYLFLLWIGMGPFLLTVLISCTLGITLRAGWGMPLQSLWGIILMAWLQPILSTQKLLRFILAIFVLMGCFICGYIYSLTRSPDTSSAHFPGHAIANSITNQWHQQFHTRLEYVAGSRWVSGNISFYSKDHPAVFIEWNPKRASWISLDDLHKKGAVFIWEISANERLPTAIRAQFPKLQHEMIIEFPWQRYGKQLAPVKLGIAYLPPS